MDIDFSPLLWFGVAIGLLVGLLVFGGAGLWVGWVIWA